MTSPVAGNFDRITFGYFGTKNAAILSRISYENGKAKEKDIIFSLENARCMLALIYNLIEIDRENRNVFEYFDYAIKLY
jgi:hypothetical protein